MFTKRLLVLLLGLAFVVGASAWLRQYNTTRGEVRDSMLVTHTIADDNNKWVLLYFNRSVSFREVYVAMRSRDLIPASRADLAEFAKAGKGSPNSHVVGLGAKVSYRRGVRGVRCLYEGEREIHLNVVDWERGVRFLAVHPPAT